MMRTLARKFASGPLGELSTQCFVPPLQFDVMEKVGLWAGSYEAIRDSVTVTSNQDIMTQCPYGMGVGILAVSLGLRLLYSPLMITGQLMGQKTRRLSTDIQQLTQMMQKHQHDRNIAGVFEVQDQLKQLYQRHGIKNSMHLVTMTQIPFVLVFYYTLVDVIKKVDIYPGLKTDGFLWFSDLSIPDPYYSLSVILALSAFRSMQVRFTQITEHLQPAQFAQIFSVMKYGILLGIPFTGMFPAVLFTQGVVLNWAVMSAFQLCINTFVFSKGGQKLLGLPEFLPGSHLDRLQKAKEGRATTLKQVMKRAKKDESDSAKTS